MNRAAAAEKVLFVNEIIQAWDTDTSIERCTVGREKRPTGQPMPTAALIETVEEFLGEMRLPENEIADDALEVFAAVDRFEQLWNVAAHSYRANLNAAGVAFMPEQGEAGITAINEWKHRWHEAVEIAQKPPRRLPDSPMDLRAMGLTPNDIAMKLGWRTKGGSLDIDKVLLYIHPDEKKRLPFNPSEHIHPNVRAEYADLRKQLAPRFKRQGRAVAEAQPTRRIDQRSAVEIAEAAGSSAVGVTMEDIARRKLGVGDGTMQAALEQTRQELAQSGATLVGGKLQWRQNPDGTGQFMAETYPGKPLPERIVLMAADQAARGDKVNAGEISTALTRVMGREVPRQQVTEVLKRSAENAGKSVKLESMPVPESLSALESMKL